MRFNCTSCGECCRRVGQIQSFYTKDSGHEPHPYIPKALADFPYEVGVDGVCSQLDQETNQCRVYEDRPLLCDLKRIYTEFPDVAETEEEWYRQCANSCNFLIKAAGLPERFIIKKPYLI